MSRITLNSISTVLPQFGLFTAACDIGITFEMSWKALNGGKGRSRQRSAGAFSSAYTECQYPADLAPDRVISTSYS